MKVLVNDRISFILEREEICSQLEESRTEVAKTKSEFDSYKEYASKVELQLKESSDAIDGYRNDITLLNNKVVNDIPIPHFTPRFFVDLVYCPIRHEPKLNCFFLHSSLSFSRLRSLILHWKHVQQN